MRYKDHRLYSNKQRDVLSEKKTINFPVSRCSVHVNIWDLIHDHFESVRYVFIDRMHI